MKSKLLLGSLIAVIVLCWAASSFALVNPRGTDETFDMATWNIETFPLRGQRTVDTLAILIRDLDLDLIAFEEISDTLAFADLLSQLPGWDGFYSPDFTSLGYQKTGLIYRTDEINILSWEPIFWNEGYAFPRPPLRITVQANMPSGTFDFYLIVLHLKAFDTDEDRARRQAAMVLLKEYLDEIVPLLPDHDWIVVGDYNDELDDPPNENIFNDFLADSLDYDFLTLPLASDPYWASYPGYNSMLDNILITADVLGEYGENGETTTLRLDDEYRNYSYVISDHRPVMAQFTNFQVGIEDTPELPENITLHSYPNPFNANTNIAFSLKTRSHAKIDLYDCLGRHREALLDDDLEAGNYSVKLKGADLSSGVYFVRLVTDSGSQTVKINLIK